MKIHNKTEMVAIESYLQRLIKDQLLSDEEAVEIRKELLKQPDDNSIDKDVGVAA
ncbi:MAG: hypothetical protein SPF36_00235 [Lachnospiraceae bacterium]|nr:hypothetical protein [Lachnospiraceae bacterium]